MDVEKSFQDLLEYIYVDQVITDIEEKELKVIYVCALVWFRNQIVNSKDTHQTIQILKLIEDYANNFLSDFKHNNTMIN